MNKEQIDDIEYVRKNLMKGLKTPPTKMSKFRIKPYDSPFCPYEIQKRFLGVFWINVTMATSFDEAERLVKSMLKDKTPTTYY